MTKRTTDSCQLPRSKKRVVEVDFSGGNVTSEGGVVLLRETDRRLSLVERVARRLPDPRQRGSIEHTTLRMLRQRVYGIAAGYEDLNDHNDLRQDLALQTALDADSPLASASTLCRFENWANGFTAEVVHEVMFETFVESFKKAPKRLVLDFDATAAVVHGEQEGRFFRGFYDDYCFMPLYVFCGKHLLVAYLRPADRDGAYKAGAILRVLTRRLREHWPNVEIVFRADSGFCRSTILSWCDRNDVLYIVGVQKNARLNRLGAKWIERAERKYLSKQRKSRLFGSFKYAADKWDRNRRVIIRAEHGEKGSNPRYVVTNLAGGRKELYEDVYCARGEAENRIKEQRALFACRVSAHLWNANQMRLLLSALAYVLVDGLRRLGLGATEFATAQVDTIRLKLLKIGAVIVRNTRRVRIMLATSCPYKEAFMMALHTLAPS